MNSQGAPRGAPDRIPVSVLTGFLGSGKTTALAHLARTGALERTLVLVNEFGEVGLDHQLLTRIDDDTLVAMDSGCICCTIRRDLAETLAKAPGRYSRGGECWFDRVVIETTGIADPAPILQTLLSEPAVLTRYRLARVLTTVDAVNGAGTLAEYEEARKQVAVADRLLLTKSDLADAAAREALLEALARHAPSVPVSAVVNGDIPAAWLVSGDAWEVTNRPAEIASVTEAPAKSDAEHDDHHHHEQQDPSRHGRVHASNLVFEEPVDPKAFEACLEGLLLLRGSDLLRIKGIINVAGMDQPMVIHGVQHVFHPPQVLEAWPDDDRRTRVVMITRDLDQALLKQCFARFGLEASAAA